MELSHKKTYLELREILYRGRLTSSIFFRGFGKQTTVSRGFLFAFQMLKMLNLIFVISQLNFAFAS